MTLECLSLRGYQPTECLKQSKIIDDSKASGTNLFAPIAIRQGDEKFLIRARILPQGSWCNAPGKMCACMSRLREQFLIRAGISFQSCLCMQMLLPPLQPLVCSARHVDSRVF